MERVKKTETNNINAQVDLKYKIKIKLFPGFTINQFTKLSLCLLKSYYDILITQIFLIKGCNYYFCTVMVTESLVTSLSLCVMDYLGLRQLFGDILLEKLCHWICWWLGCFGSTWDHRTTQLLETPHWDFESSPDMLLTWIWSSVINVFVF